MKKVPSPPGSAADSLAAGLPVHPEDRVRLFSAARDNAVEIRAVAEVVQVLGSARFAQASATQCKLEGLV